EKIEQHGHAGYDDFRAARADASHLAALREGLLADGAVEAADFSGGDAKAIGLFARGARRPRDGACDRRGGGGGGDGAIPTLMRQPPDHAAELLLNVFVHFANRAWRGWVAIEKHFAQTYGAERPGIGFAQPAVLRCDDFSAAAAD